MYSKLVIYRNEMKKLYSKKEELSPISNKIKEENILEIDILLHNKNIEINNHVKIIFYLNYY